MNQSDPRLAAETAFRERLQPILELGSRYPEASDVFIDGDRITVSLGHHRLDFGYTDFPGLTPRHVEAAGLAAAVFAGVEFGPQLPALPLLSVKLPPDLRVSYVIPPAAERWHVAIRFLRSQHFVLQDYVEQGVMTGDEARRLAELVAAKRNILVSGGTGTGKTTLLRALLELCAAEGERLVIIEDTPELTVTGSDVVHLHTSIGVDLAMLLRQTLRMSPDRIALGEVRGPEALEFVRAANTGHDGALCTLHSNGAEEALRRLHSLVLEGQPGYPSEGIRSAVDHVVQLEGRGERRRLAGIWQVPRD